MPKSDTWPGSAGLEAVATMETVAAMETLAGMESADSCDSVVSVNSVFSDDSLDHLSAAEKACLVFLEETIDSLDTEEDSGLSNDEADRPVPGNLGTKMAKLSASMSNSKMNNPQKHDSKKLLKKSLEQHKPIHSYLVPTPLVLANSSTCALPESRPSFPPERKSSQPQIDASNCQPGLLQPKQQHVAPPVPSEVNVVVIPPPTKPKSYLGWKSEGPMPRGPLSYDALVYLRRSASVKKSPLCPTVDHTIDLVKQPPVLIADFHRNPRNLARNPSGAYSHAPGGIKTSPPVVAPKPPKTHPTTSVRPLNETASPTSVTRDCSSSSRHLADPQKVRMEALQKLGLLKEDKELNGGPTTALSPSESQSASANPSRSPSFSYRCVPKESRGRPVQSSSSFHDFSPRREFRSPSNPSVTHGKKAPPAPERPRTGFENRGPSLTAEQRRSASPGVQNDNNEDGHRPKVLHGKAAEPVQTATAARPIPRATPSPVGYSVAMLPAMGTVRKEALKKLGLLRD